jgi:hypothetical protein
MMYDQSPEHMSYLLRIWRSGHAGEGQDHWRASLEEIGAGERHAFLSLEALIAFLDAQFRHSPSTPEHLSAPAGEEKLLG